MVGPLPRPKPVAPRIQRTDAEPKLVQATPKRRRGALNGERLEGMALARRLRAAADRHDAGQTGEDVTDLSSDDFIARLRR